jgi:AraC-like DNA-binding protein
MHAHTDIQELSETHQMGDECEYEVVRASEEDQRAWIANAPVCQTLNTHRIAHVGVIHARAPYRIVRMKQSGLFFLSTLSGEGRVLVGGRWQRCTEGMSVALPPMMINAFEALPGERWQFCWVRYQNDSGRKPILSSSSPLLTAFDGRPLWHAICGLNHEMKAGAYPASMFHWVELIQGYVQRFAHPWEQDDRLWRVWEKVSADVGHDWTLDKLAHEAHVSTEHLRRLCRKTLGRSPMHHVTWLRMRKACELLSTTDQKIETISHLVGYQNAFVFSNTFKKWIGWRPSEHRGRSRHSVSSSIVRDSTSSPLP